MAHGWVMRLMARAVGILLVAGSASGMGAGMPESPVWIKPGAPATLCLPADETQLAELRSGQRRAVLVVHALTASDGAASLSVSPIGPAWAGLDRRTSFYPDGSFSEAAGDDARRYFLSFEIGPEAGALCVSVALEGAATATANLSLEVSDILQK
jgi:hypothetical protein